MLVSKSAPWESYKASSEISDCEVKRLAPDTHTQEKLISWHAAGTAIWNAHIELHNQTANRNLAGTLDCVWVWREWFGEKRWTFVFKCKSRRSSWNGGFGEPEAQLSESYSSGRPLGGPVLIRGPRCVSLLVTLRQQGSSHVLQYASVSEKHQVHLVLEQRNYAETLARACLETKEYH